MSVLVREVTRRFGDRTALDRVTVEVPDGSLTALLGPAGSGGSTLLRVIAGLERPDAGAVELDGRDVTALAPQGRGVGLVSQHDGAFARLTVRDNLAVGLQAAGRLTADERRSRVEELLGLAGLSGLADRHPAELSAGQRQRLALARALAARPGVLLLDQPFAALDVPARRELRAWLHELHHRLGRITVLATGDPEEAMELADRIVVLRDGRVEQVGIPWELYEHPANAFVMGFVGPVTRLGELFIRPHDLEVRRHPDDATAEAMVERLVHLGFEVRAELLLGDGQRLQAQLTREEAELLELAQGQIVFVRPSRIRRFADVV
jgi:sulfate transport system ATP-binding protein